MTTDGGLRKLFRQHIPDCDFQSVETWSTGQGVPDLNYCLAGCEGWIELKQTAAWAVKVQPGQVGWIERRLRAGGRVLIAVRRQTTPGPRRGTAVDELWLLDGGMIRTLADAGLGEPINALIVCSGGPARWNWPEIKSLMAVQKYFIKEQNNPFFLSKNQA